MDRRSLALTGLVGAMFLGLASGVPVHAQAQGPDRPPQADRSAQGPDRFIVVLRDDVDDPDTVAAEHGRRYNAQTRHVYHDALKGYAAVIPQERVAELRSDPRVAFVSEDRPVEAYGQILPTGVDRIDAEIVPFSAAAGGPAVAVIDTGSGPHNELNVVGGKNCVWFSKSYNDGNGHGTHVAGTIGARNNTEGVIGVAPGVPIYSVRRLQACHHCLTLR